MSEYLIHLTEKEFKQYLSTLNASSIDYENNSFNKGFTFSLRMQEQAIKYCKKFAAKKIKTLLVKDRYGITVWIQAQNSNSKVIKLEFLPTTETVKPFSDENNFNDELNSSQENFTNKVPTTKVTRVYRGQTYEVAITNYPPVQQRPYRQRSRRKYRGQYID